MNKSLLNIIISVFLVFAQGVIHANSTGNFRLGNEVFLDNLQYYYGKNIALITNSTGVNSEGRSIIDIFLENDLNIVRIFTPEHGFNIDNEYSTSMKNIEIVSLYGNSKNINKKYLEDVDVLIYDIQDLGVRFYTYTSTLYLTMTDALVHNLEYVICDRPSVVNLNYTDGYLLEEEYSSFVGMIPVPVCYGLTSGELGLLLKNLNREKYYNLKLTVMKMDNYSRSVDYNDLNLVWVNPSPNIRSVEAGRLYSALCFLEGTNISEGRGTENPFTLLGAPSFKTDVFINELKNYKLEGVEFEKVQFVPESSSAYATPKFRGELCDGVRFILVDYKKLSPMNLAIAILISLKKTQNNFKWINRNFIDKLAGTNKLRMNIDNNMTLTQITQEWNNGLNCFLQKRKSILLYK